MSTGAYCVPTSIFGHCGINRRTEGQLYTVLTENACFFHEKSALVGFGKRNLYTGLSYGQATRIG
jgi:hypothetical protein